MATNDVILLDSLLTDWKKTAPTGLAEFELFELFSAEQILKDFDLATDDLQHGRVGGGNDGGIDAFYTFVNGELADEDTEWSGTTTRGPAIVVYLIQSKQEPGFKEVTFDKLQATLRDLLDLGKTREDLETVYSTALLNRAFVFRNALSSLAARHPQVKVRIIVTTFGSTEGIDPKVKKKAENLCGLIKDFFGDADPQVVFVGARELLNMARKQASSTLTLRFTESQVSRENAYVLLVNLRDYFSFITDEENRLRKNIFEWNVRDYQGGVEVNKDIQRTLEERGAPEFWWLNNGVTIIASKASITGREIALDDAQIVNGLQTSVSVYEYLAANPDVKEERTLLCRVIVTQDDATRDNIIKATNFQTVVPAASLKATDEIQRDIEAFFASNQWYYDRRKNYYRNLGKPADRIVSIPYVAQAIMAMGLSRPDDSRARPTSLIKVADDYQKIFDPDIDLSIYLWAVRTMKAVESFIASGYEGRVARDFWEFRYHLAMMVIAEFFGHAVRSPKQLKAVADWNVTHEDLSPVFLEVVEDLATHMKKVLRPVDRIAKSRDFVDFLLRRCEAEDSKVVAGQPGA